LECRKQGTLYRTIKHQHDCPWLDGGNSSISTTSIAELPQALLCRLGSSSSRDVKLARCFICQMLCKKVQFFQIGNNELMNKVCKLARKFMKYDSDSFMNVWSMTVLQTIKSEINVLRSGYASAMKNFAI
jgi:hypothetical protein